MDKYLNIGNNIIKLSSIGARSIKGFWLDAVVKFNCYLGTCMDQEMFFVMPKRGTEIYTPAQCSALAQKVVTENSKQLVFCFDKLDWNKRDRLLAQGVFFIAGNGKYVHIPGLLIGSKTGSKEAASEISAPAQYVLLYHLQVKELEMRSAKELAEIMPYQYVTLTLAFQVLKDLGICDICVDDSKTKRLHFIKSGKDLWEQVEPLLITPIRKTVFCDEISITLPKAGISALAQYSLLSDEAILTFAIEERLAKLKSDDCPLRGVNSWDGIYRIELWKYPPIIYDAAIDKLSLYLTLKDTDDPRIHKELTKMMDELFVKP